VKVDASWDEYRARTARLSDVSRQLAFAGIALLWLFSNGAEAPKGVVHLPGRLHAPALALIVALILDLLHPIYSIIGVRHYTRKAEKDRKAEFDLPGWFPLPAELLFAAKVVAVGVAYVWLFVSVGRTWI
jgi:hypothetical protein